jgi:hypothetical protein
MRVRAWLRDERYQPLGSTLFRVIVEAEGGGEPGKELPIETDADGRGTLELPAPSKPGAYVVSVRAEGAAEPLAQDVFAVEAGGDELADPRARPDVLEAIAQATGGKSFAAGSAPDLSGLSSTRSRVIGTEVLSPFASPWFFVIFAALFSAEWWLRRRYGLR